MIGAYESGRLYCWWDEISQPNPQLLQDTGLNEQKSWAAFFTAVVRDGFWLESGQQLRILLFNPSSRAALYPSSCTRTLNHHLHLSFTCTGDKCFKPVIKRKGWRGIMVQVYTPGDDLSVIPLRTSSIRSSSMTTCFALPICPSLGGLLDCDVPKKEFVSCSLQLKEIWLTSLSAP